MNIIATVSNIADEEVNYIKCLSNLGVSEYRINCAKFRDIYRLRRDVDIIRSISSNNKIMLDIPFPGKKMRINTNVALHVKQGEVRRLIKSTSNSNEKNICVSDMVEGLDINDKLWVNLGEGEFKIVNKDNESIHVEAQNSFVIYDTKALVGKGVIPSDRDFMEVIGDIKPEIVAFSFVENSKDIIVNAKILRQMGIQVISKIETTEGVNNIKQILDQTDGIMIARGDLALNIDMRDFVNTQLLLAKEAQMTKKRCIVATGIGDSLLNGGAPSRADISDFEFIRRMEPDSIILTRTLIMGNEIKNITNTLNYYFN